MMNNFIDKDSKNHHHNITTTTTTTTTSSTAATITTSISTNNFNNSITNYKQQNEFNYSPIKKRPIDVSVYEYNSTGKNHIIDKQTLNKFYQQSTKSTRDDIKKKTTPTTTTSIKREQLKNPNSQTHLVLSVDDLPTFVTIENYRIASYSIYGEPYLCLPQLLQYLKEKFLLRKMIEKFEESMIYFTEAIPKHVEGFIKASVLPPGSKSCPLIKRSDADRVCLALYEQCYNGEKKDIVQISSQSLNQPLATTSSALLSTPSSSSLSLNLSQKLIPPMSEKLSYDAHNLSTNKGNVNPYKSSNFNCIDQKLVQNCNHINEHTSNYNFVNENLQQAIINFGSSIGNTITTNTSSANYGMIASNNRPLFDQEAACAILLLAKSVTSTLMIRVYHRCFGKCVGIYYPNLLFRGNYACIECSTCHIMLTPRRFIGHTHGNKENNVCHWGFNSYNWHFYIRLSRKQTMNSLDEEELLNQFKLLQATAEKSFFEQTHISAPTNKRSYDEATSNNLSNVSTYDYYPQNYHNNINKRFINSDIYCEKTTSECNSHCIKKTKIGNNSIVNIHYSNHNENYNLPINVRSTTVSESIVNDNTNNSISKPIRKFYHQAIENEKKLNYLIRNFEDLPTFVTIENYNVASYIISGEPYLCLPQLLQYLKEKFLLRKMIEKFEESMIYFTEAIPKHVEGFIKASVLPPGSKSCPLIKRSDADRVCLALYGQCYKGYKKNMLGLSQTFLNISPPTPLSEEKLLYAHLSSIYKGDNSPYNMDQSSFITRDGSSAINDNLKEAIIKFASTLGNTITTTSSISTSYNIVAPDRPLFDKEAASSILSLSKSVTSTLMIRVYHRCFGKCVGIYYPNLLCHKKQICIECSTCHTMFSPRRFVGHTHGNKENNLCHWGFNSYNWHFYIRLSRKQTMNNLVDEELLSQFRLLQATADKSFLEQHLPSYNDDSDYEFDNPELKEFNYNGHSDASRS